MTFLRVTEVTAGAPGARRPQTPSPDARAGCRWSKAPHTHRSPKYPSPSRPPDRQWSARRRAQKNQASSVLEAYWAVGRYPWLMTSTMTNTMPAASTGTGPSSSMLPTTVRMSILRVRVRSGLSLSARK